MTDHEPSVAVSRNSCCIDDRARRIIPSSSPELGRYEMAMTPFTSLFSFKGRVSRRAYFLTVATFFIATAVYVVSTSFVIYAVLHLKEPKASRKLFAHWLGHRDAHPASGDNGKAAAGSRHQRRVAACVLLFDHYGCAARYTKLDVYAKIWDNVGVIYIGLLHGIIPFQALNWVTKEVFLGFKGTIALSGLAVAYFWFLFVRRGTVSQGAREQASPHEGAPQKIYAPRGSRRVKWAGASVAAALVLVGAGLVIWQSRGVNVSSAGVKQSTVPVFPEQLALRSCQASGRGHLETIELCTQAINSSKLLEREVAAALVSRANHYIQTKQHDKAIADLNWAIDKKERITT